METSYFVVKCISVEHLKKCIESETWAYRLRLNPPQPAEILGEAHKKGRVILIFSVNNQHGWHGICESRYSKKEQSEPDVEDSVSLDGTEASEDGWHRFHVHWLKHFQTIATYACLPLEKTKQLILVDGSPVNQARNWQQVSQESGEQLCDLIHKHYEYLLGEKTSADRGKQKHKEQSFFKSEEESVTSAQEIIGGWSAVISKVEKTLGRVILACPFGSQRYNCSLPESDNDIFIVYQAKTIDILGLDPPKQTIKMAYGPKFPEVADSYCETESSLLTHIQSYSYSGTEASSLIHICEIENSESEKIDYTVLELLRYCELLISGDPKCIETLFIYEDSILVVASEECQQLRELRKNLLTRTCVDKYLREAQGSRGIKQLEKLHGQKTDSQSSKTDKLAYIILRLLQSAQEVVRENDIIVYRPTDSVKQKELLNARKGELGFSSLMTLIKAYQEDIEAHLYKCQDLSEDTKFLVQKWLIECRLQELQEKQLPVGTD